MSRLNRRPVIISFYQTCSCQFFCIWDELFSIFSNPCCVQTNLHKLIIRLFDSRQSTRWRGVTQTGQSQSPGRPFCKDCRLTFGRLSPHECELIGMSSLYSMDARWWISINCGQANATVGPMPCKLDITPFCVHYKRKNRSQLTEPIDSKQELFNWSNFLILVWYSIKWNCLAAHKTPVNPTEPAWDISHGWFSYRNCSITSKVEQRCDAATKIAKRSCVME